MWEFFSRLWSGMLTWLGNLTARAVQAVTTFFYSLFAGLIDLVNGLIYLLAHAVDVVILVVQVLLYLVQVLGAVAGGIVRTLLSLATFDTAQITAMNNPYQAGTSFFMEAVNHLGGDTVAAILSWVWWFVLAGAILYLFSGSARQSAD